MVGHWQKRNARVIHKLNPAGIDRALLRDLFERYGKEFVEGRNDQPVEEMVLLPAMLLERLSTSTQLLANYPNPFNPKPGFPSNSVKILRLVLPFMI